MAELSNLKIDDVAVLPVSVRTYEELLKVELLLDDVDKVFPYKPETPRYKVSANGVPMGYYTQTTSRCSISA